MKLNKSGEINYTQTSLQQAQCPIYSLCEHFFSSMKFGNPRVINRCLANIIPIVKWAHAKQKNEPTINNHNNNNNNNKKNKTK